MTVVTSHGSAALDPAFMILKGTTTVGACIPAFDEAATVTAVAQTCCQLRAAGVLDEVVVVDDHSRDATAALAKRTGAVVVANPGQQGKGEALRCAIQHTRSEILVFLDADVANFSARFVTQLVGPLLRRPDLQLVKGTYRRPLHGRADEGGRVSELVARPLLERFYPALADLGQPLAGEAALRRRALDTVALNDGYGIEIGLLIDLYLCYGRCAIAEGDLGDRVHRNRPLRQLRGHATSVIDAVLTRALPTPCPVAGPDSRR